MHFAATTFIIMYNNNNNKGNHHHHHHHHHHHSFPPIPPTISPRISFSNDFVESQSQNSRRQEQRMPCPETSSDFEFSVSNHNMMSADELFFKGRILPFRGNKTTLREELLVEEDEEEDGDCVVSMRPPKGGGHGNGGGSSGGGRWKGFLGLRKGGHVGSKKGDSEGSGDRVFDNKSSQDTLNDGIIKFK